MAKKAAGKKTSNSVKIMQAIGIVIAFSMILVLFVPRASLGITVDTTSTPVVLELSPTPIPKPTVTLMASPTPGVVPSPTASGG